MILKQETTNTLYKTPGGVIMKYLFLGMATLISSCLPLPSTTALLHWDTTPAELLSWQVNPGRIDLFFSEPVLKGDFTIQSGYSPQAEYEEQRVSLSLPQEQGRDKIIGTIKDKGGNETFLILPFYYNNTQLPEVLINEFITKGSKNHPDLIELRCMSPGNIQGLTLFLGTKDSFEEAFVFPSTLVKEGDFILLHLKPDGLPLEVNEQDSPDQSLGKDSSPQAWDYWMDPPSGLSGNNGIFTLYTNPQGQMVDAVFYTNRGRESVDNYQGFGSRKLLEQAQRLQQEGHWVFPDLSPHWGIDSTKGTTTRSFCRNSEGSDANSSTDWHIVPTRGSTFGAPNSNEVYK